jgi:hypothetical protein
MGESQSPPSCPGKVDESLFHVNFEFNAPIKTTSETYPVSIRNFDAGILKQLSGNASHLRGMTFFHRYVKNYSLKSLPTSLYEREE